MICRVADAYLRAHMITPRVYPLKDIALKLGIKPKGPLVGRLPAELQSPELVYFAGIPAASAQPAPAKALIDFLAGFEAAPIIKSKGLEPR